MTPRKPKLPPDPKPVTPWLCVKCRELVYVRPDHHAYLCRLYQEWKRETTGAKS